MTARHSCSLLSRYLFGRSSLSLLLLLFFGPVRSSLHSSNPAPCEWNFTTTRTRSDNFALILTPLSFSAISLFSFSLVPRALHSIAGSPKGRLRRRVHRPAAPKPRSHQAPRPGLSGRLRLALLRLLHRSSVLGTVHQQRSHQ
jgi:hypothetical protein